MHEMYLIILDSKFIDEYTIHIRNGVSVVLFWIITFYNF